MQNALSWAAIIIQLQNALSWAAIIIQLISSIGLVIIIESKFLVTKFKIMEKIKFNTDSLKDVPLLDNTLEFLTDPKRMCIAIGISCITVTLFCSCKYDDNQHFAIVFGLNLAFVLYIYYFLFYSLWRIVNKALEVFADVGSIWLFLFLLTLLDIGVTYQTVAYFQNNSSLILFVVYCLEILIISFTLYKITKVTLEMITKVGATEVTEAAGMTEATEEAGTTEVTEAAGTTEVTEAAGTTEVTETAGTTDVTEEAGTTEVTEAAGVTDATGATKTALAAGKEYPFKTKLCFIFFLNIMHILLFSLLMFYMHLALVILSVNKNTPQFFEFGDTITTTQTDIQHELDNTELLRFLNNSYYYVTTTYSSVGYGDIVPITGFARVFSMLISLDGFFMSAVIIGLILESFKKKTDKNSG